MIICCGIDECGIFVLMKLIFRFFIYISILYVKDNKLFFIVIIDINYINYVNVLENCSGFN